MRLGAIVLKLKLAQTRFGAFIGGAAEMEAAMKYTLKKDSAFILPLGESTAENQDATIVNQKVTERFGVMVAIQNDYRQGYKYGYVAFDQLHEIRNELFAALIGWETPEAESAISYNGSRMIATIPPYMWYRFDFEFTYRLTNDGLDTRETESQTRSIYETAAALAAIDAGRNPSGDYKDINLDKYLNLSEQQIIKLIEAKDQPVDFNTIYMQILQAPSSELPYTQDLPKSDDFPNVQIPAMANWIDMTEHPDQGAYARGYAAAFNTYEGD